MLTFLQYSKNTKNTERLCFYRSFQFAIDLVVDALGFNDFDFILLNLIKVLVFAKPSQSPPGPRPPAPGTRHPGTPTPFPSLLKNDVNEVKSDSKAIILL
jgi:hypothetical protein